MLGAILGVGSNCGHKTLMVPVLMKMEMKFRSRKVRFHFGTTDFVTVKSVCGTSL